MLIDYTLGQTSIILRVKIRNSSVATGAGLTALTNASTGLGISTIADNEATATVYTAAGATIDTITTLGTFAAPTSGHCRFKEVDATNHPGIYEVQIDNVRYNVANSKSLLVSIHGPTNAAECDVVIPLRTVNPYDVNNGLQGLKGTTNPAAGQLFTMGAGAGQIHQNANGQIDARLVDAAAAGLAPFFTVNSGETYGAAVAGSVVHEITANAFTGAPGNFSSMKISPSGNVYLGGILATDLTETNPAQLAGGFKKWFDVSSPLYTINNVDDAYTRIGANGSGLTALGDTRLAFLDASVSTRLAALSYAAPLNASDTAAAVWNAASASYVVSGSTGAKLASAASAGNPWTDTLTSYTAGEAGYILKNFLTGDVYGKVTDGTIGLGAIEGLLTNATYGLSALQADITGLHNIQATDVWAAATRTLTAVDKTGYSLASNGLDSISVAAPTGVPTTFTQMMVMLYRWLFKKSDFNKSTGLAKAYADDGTTVISTQTWTDDGTTQTKGAAS